MLIKNNNTEIIHKAIIKGNYNLKLISRNNITPKLKYYNSLCGFIDGNNNSSITFINKNDNYINCYFCLKKLRLK